MFARVYNIFFFLFVALPLLATATAVPRTEPTNNQCNVGSLSCCNSVQAANSGGLSSLLGILGIVVNPITALVGLNCTPLSVIGVGGNSCSAQPVCCTDNHFNGLINVGCTPININL